jgi:hypothetical protein
VVPPPVARPGRTPFVLLVCALLGTGLLTLLLLNTVLAQNAFLLHDLQRQAQRLADREATLQQEVAEEASPQRLADRARAQGMVPSENPAFLRAADGAIVGLPKAGRPAPAAPRVRPPAAPVLPGRALPLPAPLARSTGAGPAR